MYQVLSIVLYGQGKIDATSRIIIASNNRFK